MTKIEVFHTSRLLFKAAADLFFQLYEKAVSEKGTYTVALSGGNTPRKLYELLATASYSKKINWKKVIIFWSDERCVPFSDKENNCHMASLSLLNHVPIPKENIFPVPVNFEPSKAASRYEQMIRSFFKVGQPHFDLILLGMGEDGHTASLFPGKAILKEKRSLVKQVYLEEKKIFRVSFTLPLINKANHILFLVSGKEKSGTIKHIFSKPVNKKVYPAQLVKPVKGKLFWYLDKQAANQLNN